MAFFLPRGTGPVVGKRPAPGPGMVALALVATVCSLAGLPLGGQAQAAAPRPLQKEPGAIAKGQVEKPPAPIAVSPPSQEVQEVGRYAAAGKEPSLLLQYDPQQKAWRRVDASNSKVVTGARLVSLPGFHSAVDLAGGLRLTLWGLQPETVFFPTPVLESAVVLHANKDVDLDLSLHRGRVILRNGGGKAARVLIRLPNPTTGKKAGAWELTLQRQGAEVLVERWTALPPNEPFYVDPKNPQREGPLAFAHLIVRHGAVTVRGTDASTALQQPPGKAYLRWNSTQGTSPPIEAKGLPEWATDSPGKLPADLKKEDKEKVQEIQDKMVKAEGELTAALTDAKYRKVLGDFATSDDPFKTLLALRCAAALDDLPPLLSALNADDAKRGGLRVKAAEILRHWVALARDHDQRLYQAFLKHDFNKVEAEDAMTMLHGFTPRDAEEKRTYETLIGYLDSPKPALRQLADLSLYLDLQRYFAAPVGTNIAYSPSMTAAQRQQAQNAWRKLLTEGKLPPKVKTPPPQ